MRRIALISSLLLGASVALVPALSAALDQATCCLNQSSRVDALLNPVSGGDEKMFMRQGPPPTVMFLVGNTQSMQDFPKFIPEHSSQCGDPVNTAFWSVYRDVDTAPVDADADFGASYFFDKDAYYLSFSDRLTVKKDASFPLNPALDRVGLSPYFNAVDKFTTAATACTQLSNLLAENTNGYTKYNKGALSAADLTACQTCLTTKGYFRSYRASNAKVTERNSDGWGFGTSTYVYLLKGRFLNQNPPKFVTARKVLKDVIDATNGVRLGVATFGPQRGMYDPPTVFSANPSSSAPSVGPSCAKSMPMDPAELALVKTRLREQINNKAPLPTYTAGSPAAEQLWPATTGLFFNNFERSVGESLFGIAGFFSDQRSVDNTTQTWGKWFKLGTLGAPAGFPGYGSFDDGSDTMWVKTGSPFAPSAAEDSFCWACASAAVVILTDGLPANDNTVPASKMLSLANIAVSSGINYCDSFTACGAPAAQRVYDLATDSNTTITDATGAAPTDGGTPTLCTKANCNFGTAPYCGYYNANTACNNNRHFMDDVAYFANHVDLRPDLAGRQSLQVYTIGFGDNSPMLMSIAKAGGGRFYPVQDGDELAAALNNVVFEVLGVSTSASTAAVNSIQTTSADLSAVIPRMLPTGDENWKGELWRFDQFNEFVSDQDKNDDGDKNDILIVDRDNDVVIETSGQMVKLTGGAVNPMWEARTKLLTTGYAARNVWTVLDSNGDGLLTAADSMVRFARSGNNSPSADETKIGVHLGVLGTPMCPTGTMTGLEGELLNSLGLSVASAATLVNVTLPGTPGKADFDKICVRIVIDYVLGRDLGDEDTDGNRSESGASILGDIFHSSPKLVVPPVDPFICDLGLHTQCVRTLYAQNININPTPLSGDAYGTFHAAQASREKLILVGTNGGMLHAFRDQRATVDSSTSPPTITYGQVATSGTEAWAFIPPDVLPRLHEQIKTHRYYVDGDIMVREIWADGSGSTTTHDGIKQADEFHTVAITAEGRGGTHYFALELKWDTSTSGVPSVTPKFLWMFPQPCSPEAALFGKTLFTIGPRAPPIGPILLNHDTLPAADRAAQPQIRYGQRTIERWVTAITGGWSPGLEKGRGIYILDAWNGKFGTRSDNLVWKAEYTPGASGQQTGPLAHMTHSIAAPIAMIDYGENNRPLFDGFFDTGVVGDTRGQVWVMRFQLPGTLDSATGLVNNWAVARAFESGTTGNSTRYQWPFFHMVEAAIQPSNDALRAFVGTGNRYAVLDPGPGTCRFDNPLACSKLACGTTNVNLMVDRTDRKVTANTMAWGPQTFIDAGMVTATPTIASYCGTAGGAPSAISELVSNAVNTCPQVSGGPISFGDLRRTRVECRQDSDAGYSCQRTDTIGQSVGDLSVNYDAGTLTPLAKSRFYGLWVYGGTGASAYTTFEENRTTAGQSALTFDNERLRDRGSGYRKTLVDVSNTECDVNGCTGNLGVSEDADGGQYGWALEYTDLAIKTSTAATVVAGCALWNTMHAQTPDGGFVCGALSFGTTGRLYQADIFTGAPTCAQGLYSDDAGTWARYLERDIKAPTPEIAGVIQIAGSGDLRLSTLMQEPGQMEGTKTDVANSVDSLRSIYELPLTRRDHQCRHVSAAYCQAHTP